MQSMGVVLDLKPKLNKIIELYSMISRINDSLSAFEWKDTEVGLKLLSLSKKDRILDVSYGTSRAIKWFSSKCREAYGLELPRGR